MKRLSQNIAISSSRVSEWWKVLHLAQVHAGSMEM